MEEPLGIQLVAENEIARIGRLLEEEARAEVFDGLEEFALELADGKQVAVISDFGVLLTSRTRLGPVHLQGAGLVARSPVSDEYARLTRVAYHAA